MILPNDEYAATAEAYLSLIEIINPLGGTWTVEFTARTNSGGTALDADNELYFEMYYDFTGLDGFTAVEREEWNDSFLNQAVDDVRNRCWGEPVFCDGTVFCGQINA